MKPQFFCAHQATKLKASEQYALGSWIELMRRGTRAHVECRMEAAWIYLNAAVEVSLLRFSLSSNDLFTDMHLAKPLEFLIKGALVTDEFNKATILLTKISAAIEGGLLAPSEALLNQLSQHCAQVESHEKSYLGSCRSQASSYQDSAPTFGWPQSSSMSSAKLH